VKDYAK
jgi:hypothetical protein